MRHAHIIGIFQWFPIVILFSINENLLQTVVIIPLLSYSLDESPFCIKATSSGLQKWWSGSRKTFQPACLAPVSLHQSKQFETKYKQTLQCKNRANKDVQIEQVTGSRQLADFVQYDLINSTAQQETLEAGENSWKLPFPWFLIFDMLFSIATKSKVINYLKLTCKESYATQMKR